MGWLRFLPIGPKEINWLDVIEKASREEAGQIDETELREQPDDSAVSIHRSGQTIEMIVPARGMIRLWREMRLGGCFVVAGIFVGVLSVFIAEFATPLFGDTLLGADGAVKYWSVLLTVAATMVFVTGWMLTVALVIWCVWMVVAYGCQRAIVVLDHESLRFEERTLLRTRRRRWRRDDVAQLGKSPTGHAVNQFHVYQLRVRSRDGTQTSLLEGRDEYELAWIATVLRDELGKD